MSTFVLLHSPYDGPALWAPMAELLRARRHRVAIPDLRPPVGEAPASWDYLAAGVRGALEKARAPEGGPLLLLAHGAAGLLAPLIAAASARPVEAYLFLDADLPPDGPATLAGAVEAGVRRGGLEVDLATGVADPARRDALLGARRPIPSALLAAPIPSPDEWDEPPCAYLRLSDAYAEASAEARELGWDHADPGGGHYLPLADPGRLTLTLVLLCTQLGLDLSRR
jgi:hypothetical protein